jgi:dihydroorotate dehydrogenase (NAD+) catalytic subunit
LKTELEMSIGNLRFKNPVITASGTFGYGMLMNEIFDVSQLGGIVTKSITLNRREGNLPPRISETPCGMLNSIGLENKGVEDFIEKIVPQITNIKTNIITSIAGESIEDYYKIAVRLDDLIDAIEINVSCPNVKKGGIEFGQDAEAIEKIIKEVKKTISIPLIVKLTPNVTRIEDFAIKCEDSGADAICVVNTYKGLAIDISTRKSKLGGFTGGLSGPAIKPLALYAVWKVADSVNIPVIGGGGITNYQDAIEFFMAGASFVVIGSATFREPEASLSILNGIKQYLKEEKISSIETIIGIINEN